MDIYAKGVPNLHYFFRNRVAQLYPIMDSLKIDGVLLLTCKISQFLFLYNSILSMNLNIFPYSSLSKTFCCFSLKQLFFPSSLK